MQVMVDGFANLLQKKPLCFGERAAAFIAENLVENGAVFPVCELGNVVYVVCDDDFPKHSMVLSEDVVVDVTLRGVFVSAFIPVKDDHGCFLPWEELGKEWFFDKKEAEREINRRARK